MDILFSTIGSVTSTTGVVMYMLTMVTLGWLVPRWRYNELKDELDEFKKVAKSLLEQLKDEQARRSMEARDANDDPQ